MTSLSFALLKRVNDWKPADADWPAVRRGVIGLRKIAARHFRVIDFGELRCALPVPDMVRWMRSTGATSADFDGASVRIASGTSSVRFVTHREQVPAPAVRVHPLNYPRYDQQTPGPCREHVPIASLPTCPINPTPANSTP